MTPEHILARYAAVLPFKPRPGVPVEVIGGRKYVLSTDGGPLGDSEEPGTGWLGDSGARLIQTPHSQKWRFLWVYDTEKKYVTMWRVTDGNEKEAGSDTHYGSKIVVLEKKGQINRVTHAEFQIVEREMRRREDEVLRSLQETVEANKTDYQRRVDQLAHELYTKHAVPAIQRAIEDIRAGVTPIGFKPFGPNVPERIERQMITHVVGQIVRRLVSETALTAYLRQHGIDPDAPGMDIQAVQWAAGDILDTAYTQFTP